MDQWPRGQGAEARMNSKMRLSARQRPLPAGAVSGEGLWGRRCARGKGNHEWVCGAWGLAGYGSLGDQGIEAFLRGH